MGRSSSIEPFTALTPFPFELVLLEIWNGCGGDGKDCVVGLPLFENGDGCTDMWGICTNWYD